MRVPKRRLLTGYGKLGRRTVIAVGLTPVVFSLALLLSFVGGGWGNVLVGAGISVVVAVLPFIALIFAVLGIKAGESAGIDLLAWSLVVLLLVLVGLPVFVVGVSAFLLGITLYLLAFMVWLVLRRSPMR